MIEARRRSRPEPSREEQQGRGRDEWQEDSRYPDSKRHTAQDDPKYFHGAKIRYSLIFQNKDHAKIFRRNAVYFENFG